MLDPGFILYSGAVGLIVIGIAGIVLSNHLFRMVLALAIAEDAIRLHLTPDAELHDLPSHLREVIAEAAASVGQKRPARFALLELEARSLERGARDRLWDRLAELDLPFPPVAGRLVVNVVDEQSGSIERTEIAIDPASLELYPVAESSVLALGTERGTAAATGGRYETASAWLWTLRDGRIVGMRAFHDTAAMYRAFEG